MQALNKKEDLLKSSTYIYTSISRLENVMQGPRVELRLNTYVHPHTMMRNVRKCVVFHKEVALELRSSIRQVRLWLGLSIS